MNVAGKNGMNEGGQMKQQPHETRTRETSRVPRGQRDLERTRPPAQPTRQKQ